MSEDALVIDDGRYSRLQLIAWWNQEKLSSAKVLVVGVGALGNEVVKNLALMGVGHIYMIDFDSIEKSNLTRSVLFRQSDCGKTKVEVAKAMVTQLNPDCTSVAIHGNIIADVGAGLFSDMDVVIGCLDNREARLWVNRMCWRVGTPWVDGGIQEINGVVKVFTPPDGACYECAMTENDYKLINLRYSCPLLPREDILAGKVPTAPTIASIIAGVQTQEALKLIHDMDVKSGGAFVYNGIANTTYQTQFPFKEDCLSHETYPEPTPLDLTCENSAAELFELAAKDFEQDEELTLFLDRDLIVELKCQPCGNTIPVMKSIYQKSNQGTHCEKCGEIFKPTFECEISSEAPMAQEKLSNLGIPAYDILKVSSNNNQAYYLLAGDRAHFV